MVSNGTGRTGRDVSPIASYYATVSRKLTDGSVFYPEQRLSRLEALQTYTINAAYAAFEGGHQGVPDDRQAGRHHGLVTGHHDDSEDEIPTTDVVHTIVGGQVMYSRTDQMTSR